MTTITTTDYLVIGAGPAGLQLAYFLQRNNRDHLVLERNGTPGSFFQTFPRHRMLISINKVHTGIDDPEANLRWDWNSLLSDDPELRFTRYTDQYFPSPDVLCQYMSDYAHAFRLNIQYNVNVVSVTRAGDGFEVTDGAGAAYRAKRLIVATGLFQPYVPEFPGYELCETYNTHDLDPARFRNRRVLVLGKGNSAFETANHVGRAAATVHVCSPHSLTMAWQSHFVGHLRAINNEFLDTYQLKSQNAVIDGIARAVKRDGDRLAVDIAYSHAKGQTTVRLYDHVILCTGFRFDDSVFDESCRPALAVNEKFPAQTTEWESINVPGLYVAGTLMQACDYKKTMSGFIHGFRHNIQSLSNLFEVKYHGREWPCEVLAPTPDAILAKILQRVNAGPGIFLQPGFLQDIVVLDPISAKARYYEDVRADYVHNSWLGKGSHYYTVSLEYGHFAGDPFTIERDPDPGKGNEAAYLHPIIRRYSEGQLMAEHHIQDDLESEWWRDEYVLPARAWMQGQLLPAGAVA